MSPITRRQTLGDLLRRSAQRLPHKLAVRCGDTRWTYAEFDALVTRLAAGLAGRGIACGDRVAVLARNSHGFAALRFALARLGAELARAAAALDTQVKDFIWLPSEAPSDAVPGLASFHDLAACTAPLPETPLQSTDLLQIVYTSGTESSPKGAMLTHDAVLWQYVSCVADAEIAADDLALHALPLYHCAQLDVFLGPAVYVGATNVITARPVPDNLLPLIARHRITSFFAPPTVWIVLAPLVTALYD